MVKRRVSDSEDDELPSDNSDYTDPATAAKPKPKASAARQKRKAVKREDHSDDADKLTSAARLPAAKKPKKEDIDTKHLSRDASETDDADVIVKSTSDGEKYIELGKKKRVTVRSFKNVPLVDIREFYGADGDERPGKKGIALGLEQWESLKRSTSVIDELFSTLKK